MDGIDLPTSVTKMIETCYTLDAPFAYSYNQEDIIFNDDNNTVYLLGKELTSKDGIQAVKGYVTSRLWFTYRKNFSPIGGTGPDTDQGWGCMLRCAQMLLAEMLIRRHIGPHYAWNQPEGKDTYEQILRMFLDEKTSLYSIHQIAQMGVTEGKAVGEWFGPNTAAQVLKKLCVFDSWSDIAVHVALDNILVSEDVKTMATIRPPKDAVKIVGGEGGFNESYLNLLNESLDIPKSEPSQWRPLLIVVPLRLGLTVINRCYLPAIKEYFKLESCVGIIGGRPNHALYFVGIAGDRLIYLDPHYCRPSLSKNNTKSEHYMDMEEIEEAMEANSSLTSNVDDSSGEKILDDRTYHCDMLLSMCYDQVDPSLALAFFCKTADDFAKLTTELKSKVFPASTPPIFEQMDKRPSYWPQFEPYTGVKAKIQMNEFDDMGAPNYMIDDGFEILEEDL